MLRFKLLLLLFITGFSYSQDSLEVTLFDKNLNQFLNVRDFCISKDGKEFYFTIQSPDGKISQLASIRRITHEWLEPELLPFCDENSYMEPFLSDDGLRLYFASDRPQKGKKESEKNFDLWYVERKRETLAWSEPINLGKAVNSENNEFYPTLSKNNNLYFTMDAKTGKGKDDIYCCVWNGKKYAPPVLLNDNINSSGYEFNAFISRDERFLLYTKYNAPDGQGSGDLYIARKDQNGAWQKPENLGEIINTPFMEYCPFYEENTQTLYFTSKRNNLVSKDFKTVEEFQNYVNQNANGLSKIYRVKITF
ncbi:MAG: hypothetical protein ACO1N0_00915 [Fluviicola sp.]